MRLVHESRFTGLAVARGAAQTLRAQAALGQVAPIRPNRAETTLGGFLTET